MVQGILYSATLLVTFGLTALILRFLIPYLKGKKLGQKILDIGPRWHKSKEGTPTMGGIAFIAAMTLVLLVVIPIAMHYSLAGSVEYLLLAYGYALINGLIGIIDDRAKFKKGKNQGLTASQKYLLQLAAACLFLFVGVKTGLIAGNASDLLYIPFVGEVAIFGHVAVRIAYYVFCLLLMTGMVNAVNLTDGIDGLAATVTLVVGLFFSVASGLMQGVSGGTQLLSAAMVGGCGGFLVYNFHPAKVFMGDTGSLFLGGLVVALGFLVGNPLIIILVGLIYVLEAVSVILQVGYFKLTHGKRLFKMSPIHHHFEKCGWSEVKIVSVFSLLTLIFCALAVLGCG
ncbi:MAG: phospho-N-acetylmuramoyl-pentapeptide-transferase, partial [Clostridia bacterium]|nr:phospho-N-acetylmuramoyl-pentapeptide-transferase [Clostridia bacterium]